MYNVVDGKYLGCFKDNASSRALSGHYRNDVMMTPEQCVAECESMVSDIFCY